MSKKSKYRTYDCTFTGGMIMRFRSSKKSADDLIKSITNSHSIKKDEIVKIVEITGPESLEKRWD